LTLNDAELILSYRKWLAKIYVLALTISNTFLPIYYHEKRYTKFNKANPPDKFWVLYL